jgi:hypothetical protein
VEAAACRLPLQNPPVISIVQHFRQNFATRQQCVHSSNDLLACAMTKSASEDASIPQYISFEAPLASTPVKSWTWGKWLVPERKWLLPEHPGIPDLKRANRIIYERVLRMSRDSLCVNCARLRWVKTHDLTRHFKDFERLLNFECYPIQFLAGVGDVTKQLAEHAQYQWTLNGEIQHRCAFCSTLTILYKEMMRASNLGPVEQLGISFTEPRYYLDEESHQCHDVGVFRSVAYLSIELNECPLDLAS